MNEEKIDQIMKMSTDSIDAVGDILDNPEATGLDILGVLLAMPDEDFEIIRPLFQEEMAKAYDDPQNQVTMVKMFAQSGISIDDIVNRSDEVIDELFNNGEVELSQPKKDFIKFLFTSAANSISSSTINPAHTVEIPVVLCRENAKLPTYATDGAGAMDIYSPEEYTIECGETVIIPIGIKVAIPHGYGLLIQPRSGLSSRIKLRVANTPGLIDEDFHKEIGVIVENTDQRVKDVDIYEPSDHLELIKKYGSPITIGKGERFAQMRLVEIPRVRWRQIEDLGDFKDDHGAGFGSTGVN
jgi:dUTP pyrophosphatase